MIDLVVKASAIALILVVLALGIYYANETFEHNSSVASVSIVINQTQQIKNAWSAFVGDNAGALPESFSDLLGGPNTSSYISSVPIVPEAEGGVASYPIFVASAVAKIDGVSNVHYFAYADLGRPSPHRAAVSVTNSNAAACVRLQKEASTTGANPAQLFEAGQGALFAVGGNGIYGCGVLTTPIGGGLGGLKVPEGDLVMGDYVMEYLIQ